jgi:hypothetical protein
MTISKKSSTLAAALAAAHCDLEAAQRALRAAQDAYVAALREDTARRRAALAAKTVQP